MRSIIQIYINQPSQSFQQKQKRLLPNWNVSVRYVIIVLQKSRFPLEKSTPEIEAEKDYLRAKFLRFGCELVFQLQDVNYPSDLFDPRNGYPLFSRPGDITLSDTKLVNELLGFSTIENKCSLLIHPEWGIAIYPSTIVTSASLEVFKPILQNLFKKYYS